MKILINYSDLVSNLKKIIKSRLKTNGFPKAKNDLTQIKKENHHAKNEKIYFYCDSIAYFIFFELQGKRRKWN